MLKFSCKNHQFSGAFKITAMELTDKPHIAC